MFYIYIYIYIYSDICYIYIFYICFLHWSQYLIYCETKTVFPLSQQFCTRVLVRSSCGSTSWSSSWTRRAAPSSAGRATAGSSRCPTPRRWDLHLHWFMSYYSLIQWFSCGFTIKLILQHISEGNINIYIFFNNYYLLFRLWFQNKMHCQEWTEWFWSLFGHYKTKLRVL